MWDPYKEIADHQEVGGTWLVSHDQSWIQTTVASKIGTESSQDKQALPPSHMAIYLSNMCSEIEQVCLIQILV